jgi:protein ImuB
MPGDDAGADAPYPSLPFELDPPRRESTGSQVRPRRVPDARPAAPGARDVALPLAERSRAKSLPLWLCVHFPHSALDTSARGVRRDTPLVIVCGSGSQCRVADANPAAVHAGIKPGMGLNAAFALAPWLLTVAHEPRRVAAMLERLAGWAMQFTSVLSPCPPDALLLEVRGSLKLFGGYDALASRVQTGLQRLGFTARLAAAPTPTAALWIARSGRARPVLEAEALPGALSGLPLSCLCWPAQQTERLRGMGVRTLGDCLRLPRAGFAQRFGRSRLETLDRAIGRAPDPVEPWRPPLAFSTALELPAPMQSVDLLALACERLLEELDAFLLTRQAAVHHLDVLLVLETREVQCVSLRLTVAVADTHYLMELLRERLDQVVLRAPVTEVGLRTPELQLQQAVSGDLFERTARVDEDAKRLLERLRTRLGEHSVYGLAQIADHRPEVAWLHVEPGEGEAAAAPALRRPAWMLAQPQPLRVDRDGRPHVHDGPVCIEQGPERIESGWWDGADMRRDYYVARGAGGQRLWVYRDCRGGGWYLHGLFA